MKENTLISIVGPTAIGKTRVSIEVAKTLGTEIISCDSRQFFKEMNIGTAVPSPDELNAVPHHFIQHISIFDQYSVGKYEKEALELIDEKFKTHKTLCLTGGSGLYQKAVIEGLDHFPEVDENIRKELNNIYKTEGLEPLQSQLKKLDPVYFESVDINNPHRLIRALEICLGTSKPYSSFINTEKSNDRNFTSLKIGLTADREIIYNRIEKRVDEMIESGLIEEAKSLYPNKNLNALQTVGYQELFDFFDDKISLEKAIEEIKKNTRRYAKRQLTWYRKQDDIKWFNFQVDTKEIINHIHKETRSTLS
jgi:tRNA dimethylallyltransferase